MQHRDLYIEFTEDCGPNEGGYYCQVFRSSDGAQLDDFCIHPDELTDDADLEDLARCYIDGMYGTYMREGLLSDPGFHEMTM